MQEGLYGKNQKNSRPNGPFGTLRGGGALCPRSGQGCRRRGDALPCRDLRRARHIKERFSDLIPPVKVNQKVELGAPDVNIVEQAKKEGADLIVISTHGRSGLSHTFIGRVTEKVVRQAHCPVLSIRPAKEEKAT